MPSTLSAPRDGVPPQYIPAFLASRYLVNFTEYTGSAVEQTIVFTVTGPGRFKYKSCTWYTDGEDKDF